MDADGGNVARLTDNDLFEMDPEWSPVGNKIVFSGQREDGGEPDIYTVDVPPGMQRFHRLMPAHVRQPDADGWCPPQDRQ